MSLSTPVSARKSRNSEGVVRAVPAEVQELPRSLEVSPELKEAIERHLLAGDLAEVLRRGEVATQALRDGRKLGQRRNKERADEHRLRWRAKAREFMRLRPHLTVEQLAVELQQWSRQLGVGFGNGRTYSFRTIYDDLKQPGAL